MVVRSVLLVALLAATMLPLSGASEAADPIVVEYVGGGSWGNTHIESCGDPLPGDPLFGDHLVVGTSTCSFPCFSGKARVTVVDDRIGTDVSWGRDINELGFALTYDGTHTFICNTIRVSVQGLTNPPPLHGWITIEPARPGEPISV